MVEEMIYSGLSREYLPEPAIGSVLMGLTYKRAAKGCPYDMHIRVRTAYGFPLFTMRELFAAGERTAHREVCYDCEVTSYTSS